MRNNVRKTVFAALFAGLTFCATFVIKLPTPTGGYVHMGDCLVLLSGWVLGPVWGTLAAGVGSMLADLLGGYSTYILPTFVIKCLVALVAWCICALCAKKHSFVYDFISGLCAGVITVGGYYLVEATFLGYGFVGALAGVIPNVTQAVFGAVTASILVKLFSKNKYLSEYLNEKSKH